MKKIAFVNIKGGVAKTASVTSVAHMLATQYNKRVLVVDLDPQANTTARFCNIDPFMRLERKLKGKVDVFDNSISTLLMDQNMDVHTCILHTDYKNLDIIPSDLQLGEVQDQIKADVAIPPQFRLQRHIRAVEDEYDFCIMDCAPSISISNVNGLSVCDEVYIPTTTDGDSLEGIAYALNLIRTVQSYNYNLKICGCFLTRWENQGVTEVANSLLNEMVPDLILPFRMYKSKLIGEGSYMNQPLLECDRNKNLSKLTMSYLHLTEYIMLDGKDKKEYLENYDEKKDLYLTVDQIENPEAEPVEEKHILQAEKIGIPVIKVKEGKGNKYSVVTGSRWYEVHKELIKRGIWDKYRPIPVRVVG